MKYQPKPEKMTKHVAFVYKKKENETTVDKSDPTSTLIVTISTAACN